MTLRTCLLLPLVASLAVGCAATRTSFYDDAAGISDTRLCRTIDSADRSGDPRFAEDVRDEANRRGLHPERCHGLVRNQNALIAGAAVVGTVLIARNSRNSSVGVGAGIGVGTTLGDGPSYPADRDWDWDLFHNQSAKQDQWGCRGVQSGQYTDPARCNGKQQVDTRWPGTAL